MLECGIGHKGSRLDDPLKEPHESSRISDKNDLLEGSVRAVGMSGTQTRALRESAEVADQLMKYGYFDGDKNPFESGRLIDGKSCNQIRTACLNFARDRLDLMSCFMVEDIQTIAGSGCPSIDRKVVNSGKRLRAHLGIDEVNVCSSCNLRGNCERAYVKAHEDEGGHTVDVMRFVLTYGLDHNKPFINKRLEEAIRNLTKDMVKFSKNKLDIDPSNETRLFREIQLSSNTNQLILPSMTDGIAPNANS
ncbi:hypothetical protein L1987_12001 [Smallanthus sonchifolius]|uniref:Uncharacterized protein n=1 Tax=Smallanthus sonchifolius TaxID=185202 RepID=A0ACB9JCK7_9ASTR|nr:hypothetical protein L1987_12001 [Smallanthus sonchifolius]